VVGWFITMHMNVFIMFSIRSLFPLLSCNEKSMLPTFFTWHFFMLSYIYTTVATTTTTTTFYTHDCCSVCCLAVWITLYKMASSLFDPRPGRRLVAPCRGKVGVPSVDPRRAPPGCCVCVRCLQVMMVFSYERLVPPPAVEHAADDREECE